MTATSLAGAVQSVDRAAQILDYLAERGESGVTEIAAHLHVHKSTAFRLLTTLEGWRLVEQDRARGGYRLGMGLVRLGSLAARGRDITEIGRAECERLAAALGEAVNVAVRDGSSEVNVLQVSGPATVGTRNWVGQRTPLHATSTGKVLLAGMTESELVGLLGHDLPALTEHTITSIGELARQIAQAQDRGYAVGVAELELGLNALAVPIRSDRGAPLAALSVSGPAYRLREEDFPRVAAALAQAAAAIAADLGFGGAPAR